MWEYSIGTFMLEYSYYLDLLIQRNNEWWGRVMDIRIEGMGCCPYSEKKCNNTCRIFNATMCLVSRILSERDIRILQHLVKSNSYADYIASISRCIDCPYMSVKRSVENLISLKLIESDNSSRSSYRYFKLTDLGCEFVGTFLTPVRQYGWS